MCCWLLLKVHMQLLFHIHIFYFFGDLKQGKQFDLIKKQTYDIHIIK